MPVTDHACPREPRGRAEPCEPSPSHTVHGQRAAPATPSQSHQTPFLHEQGKPSR